MNRILLYYVAVIVFVLGVALPALAYEVGDTPKFEFKSLDDKTISPETLKGYVVVINFWDSTDDYTDHQAENFVPQYEALIRQGVYFVGYNIDRDVKNCNAVRREKKFTWPQISDTRGFQSPVISQWGIIKPPPYSFVLSPKGEVVWHGHTSALTGNVEAALKKTPPQLDRKMWIELSVRQLKEIHRLLDANKEKQDYRQPLALLGTIQQPVWDDPAVQALSRKILPFFDSKKQDDQWSLATYLDAYAGGKKSLEAMRASLTKAPSSQPASKTSAADKREDYANQRLAAADRYRETEKHPQAYRAYKQIVKIYAGTAASKAAAEQVKKYEADEKFMADLKQLEMEQDAKAMLSEAAGYRSAKREDLAIETYKKVIETYPDTEWAKEAKKALEEK
ncbi:MAG: redoxin domain-containing protein [Phycisphaeraceae bacterium]|nr:redoxin domain-containing protein [Phycisphaeraceae bacterium]